MNKHKLNIHYRGSPWGSRTQQHAYCLRYARSHHIESHLGKKQPQAKIAIAFLFGQLHFNNFTSHALFYGGHLVMHSKRCAVQNQRITLRKLLPPLYKRNYNLRHARTFTLPRCKTNRFKNSFFMASGRIVNNFYVSYYTFLVLAITLITHFYNY